MSERAVVIAKDFKLPVKPGRYFRLVCMTGSNKGSVYYLHAARLIMGRGEKADIQVLDTKSSREHAELSKVGENYVVTDLGSHNGIVVNDLKVTQHQLSNNDKLIIGIQLLIPHPISYYFSNWLTILINHKGIKY